MADFPDAGGNILLSGSRIYLTPNEQDAYRVLQGKILIFLVPLADETPGRRSLLREAAAGEMLPSFRYVDADGQEWCYLFTAPEKAELAVLPGFATNPLRKRFLTSCGMEHITQEGYHNALVDRYRTNLVQEDAWFIKTERNHEAVRRETDSLIASFIEQSDPDGSAITKEAEQPFALRAFLKKLLASFSWGDLLLIILLTGLISCIGLLIPTLYQLLYDRLIPQGLAGPIFEVGLLIGAFLLGNLVFQVFRGLCSFRISNRIRIDMQNAVYRRIFELPEHFFRQYESADLAGRILSCGDLAAGMADLLLSVALGSLSALVFFARMLSFSTALTLTAIGMTLLKALLSCLFSLRGLQYQRYALALAGRSDSVLYQFLNGIEKIRISGIEDRAIYEYLKSYIEQRKAETKIDRLQILSGTISLLADALITVLLYSMAYRAGTISIGSFAAFLSAYGIVSGAILGIAGSAVSWQMMKPSLARIRPIYETETENSGRKEDPGTLSGRIDLDHISFAYDPAQPVIRDLSLHIRPGEYIGIAGTSGCGKSTLLKLLLGFEAPTEGVISYDGQDLQTVDLQKLRSQFGVVLQDGELIAGSIYENITLTAGDVPYEQVAAAVDAVGLRETIDEMPMGLETIVSENCRTISGGQKQRILIARAILNQPKVLFFDEATSALDNVTQEMVTETLRTMDCTKIVIAHRLSTIRSCDRILVLDAGTIAEEGTYDSLMAEEGLFYRLAHSQLL